MIIEIKEMCNVAKGDAVIFRDYSGTSTPTISIAVIDSIINEKVSGTNPEILFRIGEYTIDRTRLLNKNGSTILLGNSGDYVEVAVSNK